MALSLQAAKERAAESREMAMRSDERELQIMLYHIAETWERIAKSLNPSGR